MNACCVKLAWASLLLSLIFALPCFGGPVSSLDDIEFWVGSGANQAAFLLDWDGDSTGDQSLAWGYHWDGSATGEDMLKDLLVADARLFAKISAGSLSGIVTYGVGYDQNDDGQFAISDDTTFDSDGIAISGPADLATSVDPNDLYSEGWWLGFWHLGAAATNPFAEGSWADAGSGISGLGLVDGLWTSLAFTTDILAFGMNAYAENPIAAATPGLVADFDMDNDVDGADFLTWQRGFGTASGATLLQGDANGDEVVDSTDLQLWSTNFGSGTTDGAMQSTVLAVPEPPYIACVLWGFFVLFFTTARSRTS